MSFSADELARYARHLSLAGFGPEAQAKLKHGSVLVIGAGGLGCPALLYLAAAGVGRIVIVDGDRVDVSNLQRQVLYTSEDEGEDKTSDDRRDQGRVMGHSVPSAPAGKAEESSSRADRPSLHDERGDHED